MKCASCGTDNREGRRFCASCGAALALVCPSCGATNEPGERFCGDCGTSLALGTTSVEVPAGGATPAARPTRAPAASSRRERKVATILFADLVGFTGLNEAHDPELVQSLVATAFDRLSLEVARYEGLIEKFAGDAMLALFGVPQIHEDDAERAVRAALEMQASMLALSADAQLAGRPELSLRIGIDTGEVLVDLGRAAEERDRMVTGDPVNTAARFEAAAAPGTIIVGAGTYAATRNLIDYEELAPLTLKGKAQPVPAWRAVSVKARRGGVRAPLGIQAPLVGRDGELSLLKETVRRTVTEGRPHLVSVFGDAGVGKSRLAWELEKYLDGLPEPYVWRKGRSLAYGQGALGALAELIRVDASIRDDEAPDEATAKLEVRLDALGIPAAKDREIVRGALGLRDVPQVAREELFDSLRRYLEALADVAPAILVFEDIHWADEGLLDLLESVARWGSGPMLLLCLTRHELLERRPSWAGGMPNAASIVLEPLGTEENARLVEGLMPGGIPAELRQRIVQLAEGNALFTEELVRMFVDRGVIRFVEGRWQLALAVDELEVPGSVQAVLAARLDALPEREKHLAQDAAVVGRIFWDAVLAYLAGDPGAKVDDLLRRLRVKELVVPREPSSLSGAAEFGFRHVLIRDVAYDSLSKGDRAAKHLSVAQWAERELSDRTEEISELLASHYQSALRYREEFSADAEELTRLREQTYRYARLAARRAGRLWDAADATRWGRIAIELANKLGLDPLERATVARDYLVDGVGYWPMTEAVGIAADAMAALETIIPWTPEVGVLAADIAGTYGYALHGVERVEDARAVFTSTIDRIAHDPPSAARSMLKSRLGWLMWRTGPSAIAARPILEDALAESRALGDTRTEAWALHELGVVKGQTGDLAGAAEMIRESLRLAKESGDSTLVVRAHANLPAQLMDLGAQWEEIEELLQEGIRDARRGSSRHNEGWIIFQLAEARSRQGRLAEAADLVRQSIEIADQTGDGVQAAVRRTALAWNAAERGRWDEADALEIVRSDWGTDEQTHIFDITWEAWSLWRTDPDGAVELLERELPDISVDRIWGLPWLARMALRTGSESGVHLARSLLGSPDGEGPFYAAMRAWVVALDQPTPEVASALALVAETFESMGYRVLLENVFCDIALAQARTGDDPAAAIRRVAELDAANGGEPVLGPLPETRWIGPAAEVTAAAPPRG